MISNIYLLLNRREQGTTDWKFIWEKQIIDLFICLYVCVLACERRRKTICVFVFKYVYVNILVSLFAFK